MKKPPTSLGKEIRFLLKRNRYAKATKIFCIGRNKTGTTSMARLFREFGLDIGPQREFEALFADWRKGDYKKIIDKVRYRGVAFQDIPFSLPHTYEVLDKEFPDSKFILTVRDSEEAWYQSVSRFHAKKFAGGNIPTKEDLQNANYIYPGWMWEVNRAVYNTPEDDVYHEETFKKTYLNHNAAVINYFKDKPGKLLVVNLMEENALQKITDFLGVEHDLTEMPWENRT